MQKWEYAELYWSRYNNGHVQFSSQEDRWEVSKDWDKAFSETMRRLGDEGWELVALISSGGEVSYYTFKRPQQTA